MRRGGEKFNWRLIFFIFTRLNTFQTFRLGLEQTKKTPKKPCHVQSKSFFCHVDYHLSRIINEKTKKNFSLKQTLQSNTFYPNCSRNSFGNSVVFSDAINPSGACFLFISLLRQKTFSCVQMLFIISNTQQHLLLCQICKITTNGFHTFYFGTRLTFN